MAELTKEQLQVLIRHRIPISSLFDATGLRTWAYKSLMKADDKLIAIGVVPCLRGGHTMRTRAGHCLECNPAGIGYIRRHYKNAFVYVAGSRASRLLKIGSGAEPTDRVLYLNRLGYGEISDWSLLSYVKCNNAGNVEFDMHRILSRHSVVRSYVRDGMQVKCREIFSCGYKTARRAMSDVLGVSAMSLVWERDDAYRQYNFD